MERSAYISLKNWFRNYTENFLRRPETDVTNIKLKIDHTFRVCGEMELLTGDLSREEWTLAMTAALLHDVGRFEQFARYGTFADFRSEDHASLGVRILKENEVLKDIPSEEREIILLAVENHNKAEIASGLTEKQRLISGLTRDADKLDILRLVIDSYRRGLDKKNPSLVHNLPEGADVSPPVFKALMGRRKVTYDIMKTVVDMKLLQMGWVYDLDSEITVRLFSERGYLEALYSTLARTEKIETIYREMKMFLESETGALTCTGCDTGD